MNKNGRFVLSVCGQLPKFLVSSSSARFIRAYTDPNGDYAEYFFHTPDELHEFTTAEMVTVAKVENTFHGEYDGEMFEQDTFSIQGGN